MKQESQTIENRKEQRFFNDIVSSAEFWGEVDDMSRYEVIEFHRYQLKRHQVNRDRTNNLETIARHSKAILEHEGIIAILESGEA